MSSTELELLPCLDSGELATHCRQQLAIPRHVAAELGRSAVQAVQEGTYQADSGKTVDWRDQVEAACAARCSIPPDGNLPCPEAKRIPVTRVQVTNETTLSAARRLVETGMRPLALNFANGIHPGGGFLNGARAQEETLCRSSALYLTLVNDPMYTAHRQRPQPDSTDWAIYSPDVPVFRNDDGSALEEPWLLSFVTCAAPYAPALGQMVARSLLKSRIRRVLAIAQAYEYVALVLGAWGCGAFGNDPHSTAVDFREALEGDFSSVFSDVVFAITDWSPQRQFLGPFRDVFGES